MGVVMRRITVYMSAGLVDEVEAKTRIYGVSPSEFVRNLIIERLREDRITEAQIRNVESKKEAHP